MIYVPLKSSAFMSENWSILCQLECRLNSRIQDLSKQTVTVHLKAKEKKTLLRWFTEKNTKGTYPPPLPTPTLLGCEFPARLTTLQKLVTLLLQMLKFCMCSLFQRRLPLRLVERYSPWARTLKRAIWYQNEGLILTLIFNNIDSSRLYWCMITMPNEQLYQDYHVIK